MNSFSLRIVTPEGEIYSGEAKSITLSTIDGEVQILAGHADYFSALACGRVKIVTSDSEERRGSSSGGFLTVKAGKVEVVFTTFEYAENIDLARARLAKEKAEAMITAARNAMEEKRAKAKLARALSRLNVADPGK